MTRLRGSRIATLIVLAAIGVAALPPSAPGAPVAHADGPALNGGGSSFAKLEIDQWRAEVARAPYNLSINYVAQGSSFGRQQYSTGSLEFAASDIPFTADELAALPAARKDFVYVPVSAGGLGFMYNLVDVQGQQVTNLNLTPQLACQMFTDPEMMWNNPELQAINPQITLPAERVRAIVRSDGSGTSYVLSEYCIATSPNVWQPFVASLQSDNNVDPAFKRGEPTSNWPPGIFGSALAVDGVAAAVADSSGLYGITYNEAGFAKIRGFPNANVRNAAGVFTQPTEAAVSIALGYATGRENGTFELDFDGPDPGAYFPSTYSYIISQTTGFDPAKGEVLARFLCYAITKGQRVELTETLGYARLSAPLVELGRNAIAKIPGAPPWENCKVGSAPPPPPPSTAAPSNTTAPPNNTTVDNPAQTPSGDTPSGGTVAPGATPSNGTVASGAPVSGQSSGSGSQSTGGQTSGGAPTQQTVVSIDPETGESVVVMVPIVESETGCVDPITGLPAQCGSGDGQGASGDAAGGDAAGAQSAAAPAAVNPPISADESGPGATRIVWWLLQGACVCGVGVALAGARRRFG
ncbi:MAG: substrate-binding domain-containing protein [Actinobacteria bacterium]|nr:substrate-binding domain-containing protein [Actinomycetota bacterium]